MRSQRSGMRTMRRSDERPRASRNCAVQVLTAIMKSSISSAARVRPLRGDVAHVVSVEDRPALDRVERQRTAAMSRLLQRTRGFVLPPQVVGETSNGLQLLWRWPLTFQPRADGWIGQLRVIPNRRQIDVRCPDRSIRGDRHLDDHRGAIGVFVERRQIRGQPLRQHRKDLGRGVDGRGVDAGMPIDRRITRDQRIDIGNGDEDRRLGTADLGDRELIQIARVVVVDGAPQKMAQVAPALSGCRVRPVSCRLPLFRQLLDLGRGCRRKRRLEPAFQHRLTRDRSERGAGIGHPR